MDNLWISVGRIVAYVVIFALVKLITTKVSLSGKMSENNDKSLVITKKNIASIFLIVAIVFAVIFIVVSFFPSNLEGKRKIIAYIIMILICLSWCALSIMYSLWFIRLNDSEILIRNYIGRKKRIPMNEITTYEIQSNGNIEFCNDQSKLLTVEAAHAQSVLIWLIGRVRLEGSQRNKRQEFVVRPAQYHRVLAVLCLVVSISALVLCIYVKSIEGIIFFILFTVFCIYNCCSQFMEKYCVGKDCIMYSNFLKKAKNIKYSDISKIVFKEGDNVSYYYVYTKSSDHPSLKMNTYYENIVFFRELIDKKKWLK